jgi:hypothetical protein
LTETLCAGAAAWPLLAAPETSAAAVVVCCRLLLLAEELLRYLLAAAAVAMVLKLGCLEAYLAVACQTDVCAATCDAAAAAAAAAVGCWHGCVWFARRCLQVATPAEAMSLFSTL